MSTTAESHRPSFLDELAHDASLTGTITRKPVTGMEEIARVLAAVGSLYASQTVTFEATVGEREFLEYDAELIGGPAVHAIVALTRNKQGKVSHIDVGHGPLDGAIEMSARLSALGLESIDAGVFLERIH
jgi:hypothetical protein